MSTPMTPKMERMTVGRFLIRRLREAGVEHMFGVPGDFNLGFLNEVLAANEVKFVGTCNELNAAYAADGYARVRGMGACVTTYTVGELSAINGIGGCFAENVPVVKITGAPSTACFRSQPLLHHTLGDYRASFKCFQQVTCAQTILSDPDSAVVEIDRVLHACLSRMLPVYIGLPSDIVLKEINVPAAPFTKLEAPASNSEALHEAVLEVLSLLHQARKPVLMPGVEILRRSLKSEFEAFLKASGVPFAAMMLSKALIDETHPQCIGLYSGDRSRPYVQDYVESSDCLLIFGEKLSDFNTGGFSAKFDRRACTEIGYSSVRVHFHRYDDVYIHDFLREMTLQLSLKPPREIKVKPAAQCCSHRPRGRFSPKVDPPCTAGAPPPPEAPPEAKMTHEIFFGQIAEFLDPRGAIVLAETGVSLFSASETLMPSNTTYIGQAFYGSIGFTVGATLGACVANGELKDLPWPREPGEAPSGSAESPPEQPQGARQVYLFVGDGSFQMTCQEVSTLIRYGCAPIIFLINNDGYTIERVIVDRKYNDIQPWRYVKLLEVFGGGRGHVVRTKQDLDDAFQNIKGNPGVLHFVEVFLDRMDCSHSLQLAGLGMAMNNHFLSDSDKAARRRMLELPTDSPSGDEGDFRVAAARMLPTVGH